MHLVVVRHGQTIENTNDIVQGQLPGRLSAEGVEQALATAVKLQSVNFDAIYCSDLKRCMETAEIIAKFHPANEVIYTADLRERKGGIQEGKPSDWNYWNALPGSENSKHYPGGESWEDVYHRVKPFVNQIYELHPNDTVLFVTHGGVVRSIRALTQGITLDELVEDGTPNAGIWEFDITHNV